MTSENNSLKTLFRNHDIAANVLEFLKNPDRHSLTSSCRELAEFRKTTFLSYHLNVSEYLSIKDDHKERFGEALIHLKPDISDIAAVSALGSVHTLHLSRCDKILDVSALSNVHTLDLRGCKNVKNILML